MVETITAAQFVLTVLFVCGTRTAVRLLVILFHVSLEK